MLFIMLDCCALWCNYEQSCLHLQATLGAMLNVYDFPTSVLGAFPYSSMHLWVHVMTCGRKIFPVHCFMYCEHLIYMLFARGFLPMN